MEPLRPEETTMPSNEELSARMDALEARMDLESGLRASVDRDVADQGAAIRATHHLVRALAITQGEHTRTLAGHTATLAEHTTILARHTEILGRNQRSLTLAHGKLDRIIGLLEPPGGRKGS
jgi:hypothetical protein